MCLGLVPASSGAEALRECGWQGPCNYTNDTGQIAAVVLDWERRFGARVVGVGFAEHFAFCPDSIWQGRRPHTLAGYAKDLVVAEEVTRWVSDLRSPNRLTL
ncbi:DUF4253 domain-containing protein [Streptomyces fungicidicus]